MDALTPRLRSPRRAPRRRHGADGARPCPRFFPSRRHVVLPDGPGPHYTGAFLHPLDHALLRAGLHVRRRSRGAFLWWQRNHSRARLSRFLWTRGLWLIVLELTVMQLAYYFSFSQRYPVLLLVLWALGGCMIVLAALVYLPCARAGGAQRRGDRAAQLSRRRSRRRRSGRSSTARASSVSAGLSSWSAIRSSPGSQSWPRASASAASSCWNRLAAGGSC